jgi:hypothetical protein
MSIGPGSSTGGGGGGGIGAGSDDVGTSGAVAHAASAAIAAPESILAASLKFRILVLPDVTAAYND